MHGESRRLGQYCAYTAIDRVTGNGLRRVHRWEGDGNLFIDSLVTSVQTIKDIVAEGYNTFETCFCHSDGVADRVDFEMTFMTKSYIDHQITIPAAANRDMRTPRSMVLRKENPEIYSNTETASVYRAARPAAIIVEDTSNAGANYAELYAGQKERIRSSIIYPVLSDSNELLGTLVVHCDSPAFFSNSRQRFWFDLLEVFAKRIAVEKMKLDKLVVHACSGGIHAARYVPPF
ncbi:MAG: GAF domain-containing protein [Tepidisphaeraceae bacterium]